MSFILPSTLEESLCLADDICAILYTMYHDKDLVLTDWELVSFILLSTLQYEKILSARVDIGHMCVIIQESSKERMQAVREFYARRDKSLESPIFESGNV